MRIAALYMAAGRGSRMGGSKPSVELAPGIPLGRAALLKLMDSELDPIVVAVREGDPLEWFPQGNAARGRFVSVVCPDADEGLSRSIRRALGEALRLAPDLQAAVVALADQPMLSLNVIRLYVETFRDNPDLEAVAGAIGDEPVTPVLWNRSMFGELAALEGDSGGRNLLRRQGLKRTLIPLDGHTVMDVDTPMDLEAARKKWETFSAK
jgi:molybdenum cofactor cytidylyltransferase